MRQGDYFQNSFCFLQKLYIDKIKASGQHLNFNRFWWTSTWTYNKKKLYNISDC